MPSPAHPDDLLSVLEPQIAGDGRLPHLTLAQVFDALSYYQEHREAIDEDIRLNRVPAEKIHLRLQ